MPKVIMSSDLYGAEEFPCSTLEEAADTVRRLALKAYEELLSGDGVERLVFIAPDEVDNSPFGADQTSSKTSD